jgi:hypothetical protein
MGDLEIDFKCRVAKYKFRPGSAEEVARQHRALPWEFEGIPEAEWPVYMGDIVPTSEAKIHRPPMEKLELAVRALVEYKDAPFHKIVLTVVRAVGAINPSGDLMRVWYHLAGHLRNMFGGKFSSLYLPWKLEFAWPHPKAQEVGEIGVFLVPGENNEPLLALRPRDLRQALTLCAARMISAGTTFNICRHCKTSFLSGGSRGKKRSDARFCSDKCRYSYHNEANRKLRG